MTTIKTQNKKIYSAYDEHITCNIFTPPGEDKTKQSFGDECDINCIMAKYVKTGILESQNSHTPHYGDNSAFDFQEAQNTIIVAETLFNALPAKIRSKFDNNPHEFLEFMDNPANQTEALAMGLLRAPEVVSGGTIPLATEGATTPHQTANKGAGVPHTSEKSEKGQFST